MGHFHLNWKHQIQVEKILDYDEKQQYPYCLAGKNACPPEQIRGVEDFLEVRDLFKIPLYELVAILKVQDYFGYNWHPDVFKKSKINNQFLFVNADGKTDSKGLETNIKFSYDDFKLYLQYAFIDAQLDYDGINRQKPITPRHNAGGILMYESGKWRLGYEVYSTGGQTLFDLSPVEDYWTIGLLVSRQIEKLNVFVSFENFTDTRLSKFQDTVIPPHTHPSFPEIWTPTDGFIFTAGLKWTIFGEVEEE